MAESNVRLGDHLYETIDTNAYLTSLHDDLLVNYGLWRLNIHLDQQRPITDKDLDAALRFADILSKSTHPTKRDEHKNQAQELVTLATTLYPDNPRVQRYAATIFATLSNYPALKQLNAAPEHSALDDAFEAFQRRYLQVPGQEELTFFAPQKEAFDHIEEDANYSFSAPTSLGKSFIIRSFIESRVRLSKGGNYAILVPSKALINETRSKLIANLTTELAIHNYRIVTAGGDIVLEGSHHFIFVLTPERLLYLLINRPDTELDYVFVDEAHKISAQSPRAAFYYQVIAMLQQRRRPPRFVFSSPNIPNPEVFLEMLNDETTDATTTIRYSPVSQFKFIIDGLNNEVLIHNDRTGTGTRLCGLRASSDQDQFSRLIGKLTRPRIPGESGTQTLVYVNSRIGVADSARDYAATQRLPIINDPELEELSRSMRREIHDDFYLADLVRRGVAYHVGYLPPTIREKLEDLYRKRKVHVMFTTSTLLEGVNLPADNLIIKDLKNGPAPLSVVDFKNLTGRVGRIEYNHYGNVFIYIDTAKSRSASERLLNDDVENQTLAIDTLSEDDYSTIVNRLIDGQTAFPEFTGWQKTKGETMRKFALVLLREITSNRPGLTSSRFAPYLDDAAKQSIKEAFAVSTIQQDDDINISVDQAIKVDQYLERPISNAEMSPYPAHAPGQSFNYNEVFTFLTRLGNIFDWPRYEADTIGQQTDDRYGKLRWYAVLLVQWMEGKGLRQIIDSSIYHKRKSGGTVRINWNDVRFDDSQLHRNVTYNEVLDAIESIILFRLANYFLRFSNDFKRKTGVEQFPNDWYEYVEYGTDNPATIGLQRLGFSRESAAYLRNHADRGYYIVEDNNQVFLHPSILKCDNPEVRMEASEIQYNIPEFMLENG